MLGRAARVLRLPPAEQIRILRLAALRAALELGLRAIPVPRLVTMLGLRMGSTGATPAPPLHPAALTAADLRALRAADLLTSGAGDRQKRCLRHALLAGHALRHYKPVLRIGAARTGGKTTAHAWIELLGGRIDLDDATEYLPLRSAVDADRLLYEAVRDRRVLQITDGPPELLDYVKRYRLRIMKLNLLLKEETRRAIAALDAAGVQSKVLGGPPIGDDERDVVIGVPDRELAMAVLEKAGYTRAESNCVRTGLDAILRIRGLDEEPPAVPPLGLGAFEPTPPEVVEAMLDLARVGEGDTVVDLGAGDGRILRAAERRGATAIGYETNPVLVDRARSEGLTVVNADARSADLSAATVVALYVRLEAALEMLDILKAFVARGGRIVAHHVDLGLWPSTKQANAGTGSGHRTIRLWQM